MFSLKVIVLWLCLVVNVCSREAVKISEVQDCDEHKFVKYEKNFPEDMSEISEKECCATDSLKEMLNTKSLADEINSDQARYPTSDCIIDINTDLGDPQPLLIKLGTNELIYPYNKNGTIVIPDKSEIEIGCPTKKPFDSHTAVATCHRGASFDVNGVLHDFKDLKCGSNAWHTAQRTGATCFNGSTLVEIGFDFGNRFFHLMDICHDEDTQATLYSHYKLTPSNVFHQKSVRRQGFIAGVFFGTLKKQADSLYSKESQKKSFTKILGSEAAGTYLTSKMFLARGHLAAKSDFIFGAHQRATFYLLNAAPQWQLFNGANWEHIENSVRKFLAQRDMVAEIFTGTYGTTTLPDSNGVEQELYLNFPNRIPVPMVFYKLIIDTVTRNGVVLVGVNNPYLSLEQIYKDYIFCTDVSADISWIKLSKHISKGYTYACDVNNFKEHVQHLPDDLVASGLLI